MELLERIEQTAKDSPTRDAYVLADGHRLTYAALHAEIAARADALRNQSSPGQAAVLHLGNVAEFAPTFLAAIAAGVHVLLLAGSASSAEVAAFADRLSTRVVLPRAPTCISKSESRPSSSVARGDLLLPTSGSTGAPKIVRRDARSIDAVAANMVEAIGFRPEDRVLAAVPLAHSYGIEHGLLAPLWAGATVHLFDGIDIDAIAAARESFNIFPAVPSMLERLNDAGASLDVLRRLRTIYSAGAPLPDAVRDRFVARFGVPVGQLYGATEIGTVTYRAGDARPGKDVGWPMRAVSIRSLDSGEIAIRSPSMFSRYFDEPAELVDGHFLTGDLGHVTHDGALELVGRSKLLIDVGGLKVNPLEVEVAIASHAQVAECAVVPLMQSETVQRLRAIIVPKNATMPPTADALRTHVRGLLATHKVPRSFEIRTLPLPRSATGKLLRTMLVDP